MGGAIGLVLPIGGLVGAPPVFLLFYVIYEQQNAVGIIGMGVATLMFLSSVSALVLISVSGQKQAVAKWLSWAICSSSPQNGVFMVNTGNPMPQKSPLQVEKEFRSFLRSKSLKLASLTLPQAVDAMVDFWSENQDFEVLSPNGDGLAAYEDVTDNGVELVLKLD